MRLKYSKFFAHAVEVNEKVHVKKESFYQNIEKPNIIQPTDHIKEDDKFMESKEEYLKDTEIKTIYEKKITTFVANKKI